MLSVVAYTPLQVSLRLTRWRPADRRVASAESASIKKRFALVTLDISDASVKSTYLGGAEGQFDHSTRLQRLLGARLGPACSEQEGGICDQFRGPMLDFAFIARSIEHQPRMGIGILELNHGGLGCPEMLHIVGDAASVMGGNRPN